MDGLKAKYATTMVFWTQNVVFGDFSLMLMDGHPDGRTGRHTYVQTHVQTHLFFYSLDFFSSFLTFLSISLFSSVSLSYPSRRFCCPNNPLRGKNEGVQSFRLSSSSVSAAVRGRDR